MLLQQEQINVLRASQCTPGSSLRPCESLRLCEKPLYVLCEQLLEPRQAAAPTLLVIVACVFARKTLMAQHEHREIVVFSQLHRYHRVAQLTFLGRVPGPREDKPLRWRYLAVGAVCG